MQAGSTQNKSNEKTIHLIHAPIIYLLFFKKENYLGSNR